MITSLIVLHYHTSGHHGIGIIIKAIFLLCTIINYQHCYFPPGKNIEYDPPLEGKSL